MIVFTQVALAVLLDAIVGELKYAHPLNVFGSVACKAEKLLRQDGESESKYFHLKSRLCGSVALFAMVVPPVLFVCWLQQQKDCYLFTQVVCLYFAIGMRSLSEHGLAVVADLRSCDINAARRDVGLIVSRDTEIMSETDICKATVESILENGSDAVYAPLFWFVIFGAPGAVLYRLTNTLDAMWGYKTPRYLYFGYAAARLDDVLNWIPARLTALTYTVLGDSQMAWWSWREQAKFWYSPNAGPVMAAGAGALNLSLGGPAVYHGALKDRPALGLGRAPSTEDIGRSITLVRKGLLIWVILLFMR